MLQRGGKPSTGLKQQCICYHHFVVDPTNPEGIILRIQEDGKLKITSLTLAASTLGSNFKVH